MRHAWITLLLVGCESVPPSGEPFTPVKVQSIAEPIADEGGEPWFDDEPEVMISSEEMADGSVADVDDEPQSDSPPAAEAAVQPAVAAPSVPAVAPMLVPSLAPLQAPSQPMVTGGSHWPVRLVRTLPDTLPPRAILGLPDGSEIVVTPGSMVPEQGLVVVAIGRETAQLARVSPQGDHAAIQPLLLNAQY